MLLRHLFLINSARLGIYLHWQFKSNTWGVTPAFMNQKLVKIELRFLIDSRVWYFPLDGFRGCLLWYSIVTSFWKAQKCQSRNAKNSIAHSLAVNSEDEIAFALQGVLLISLIQYIWFKLTENIFPIKILPKIAKTTVHSLNFQNIWWTLVSGFW